MRRGLAGLLLAGCFHPTPAQNVPCSDHGLCPDGQSCDMTQSPPVCIVGDAAVTPGADADVDAPVISCATMSCPANEPVCDPATTTCRGCVADSECPFACHELTGQCVADADILYVAPTAMMDSPCTQASPCPTITKALAHVTAQRSFIAIAAGTYVDSFSVSVPVTLSGPSTDPSQVTLQFTNLGGTTSHVIDITAGVTTVVEGLTTDGLSTSGDTIRIETDSGTTTLFRVRATNAGQSGVFARGTTNVLGCELDNNNQGINMASATTVIDRSEIHDNTNLGVHAQGTMHLRNSIVSSNGGTGVQLGQGQNMIDAQDVAFSTIVSNGASGSINAGLDCRSSRVTVDSTIVASNGTTPQVASQCQVTYSLYDDATPSASPTNITNTDPGFVSVFNADYHLTNASPAIDTANPSATNAVDFDGNHRPHGAGFDIGAYEH